jgi:hypothetical protein
MYTHELKDCPRFHWSAEKIAGPLASPASQREIRKRNKTTKTTRIDEPGVRAVAQGKPQRHRQDVTL